MSHAQAGHYASKHAPASRPDARIAALARQFAAHGKLTCAAAHRIAQELGVSPAEVGVTLDLLEIRISQCQLGLFGYSPQKRLVQPAAQVSPALRLALMAAQCEQGLPCAAAWELASSAGVSKLELAAACEALRLKIKTCQLGAF